MPPKVAIKARPSTLANPANPGRDDDKGRKELVCPSTIAPHKPFVPQPHQLRVTDEFLATNKRGLLFYHALGSGKTCSAYMAIDAYRKAKGKKKVYILAPAALASSHQHQYCDVCGEHPHDFNRYFNFFSYNDTTLMSKWPRNMNDSIIIIDEVQTVVNGKYNKSATLAHVYDSVLKAERVKVILLSGTPIFAPYQAALLGNLLEPGLFNTDEDTFEKDIDRPDYLYRMFQGLISYVPIPDPQLYPTRILPDIIDFIPMSKYQFDVYRAVREKELEMKRIDDNKIAAALRFGNRKRAQELRGLRYIQLTKLISRQICNFAYPDEIMAVMRDNSGKLTYKEDLNASWILNDATDTHVQNLKMYSPKMAKLIHRLLTLPGKHMVYGWMKSKYGLHLIYTYLKHCGIIPLVFSGDTGSDEKRAQIIDAFNSEENRRGEIHKIILVSGAGAMGISLFGVRHFHSFEASINEFITVQAEGRAFRTMSHHQLPPEERNVQVYRYISILPPRNERPYDFTEEKTTEEMIYAAGLEKMQKTEKILDIMRRSAFDCREKYNSAIKNCYDGGKPGKKDEKEEKKVVEEAYDFDEDPYAQELDLEDLD